MDKIICFGKNYALHVQEMGGTPQEKPVIFLKPPSILRQAKAHETITLTLPPESNLIHHECEVVIRLKQGGYRLKVEQAQAAIAEVTVGLDMTRRDTQTELKKKGEPWEISKVFPDSAVVGPWRPVTEFSDYLETPFSLSIDGKLRQRAIPKEMLLSPSQCISYASSFFPLVAGDILFTGTPAGVHSVKKGQRGTLRWGDIVFDVLWKGHDE